MCASLDFRIFHLGSVFFFFFLLWQFPHTLFVRSAYGEIGQWCDRSTSMHAICEMLTSSDDFVVINMVSVWHTENHQIGTETTNNQNKIKTFCVHIIHFGLWFGEWHYPPHFIWCFYSFVLFAVCVLPNGPVSLSLLLSLDDGHMKLHSVLCRVIHFVVKHICTCWCHGPMESPWAIKSWTKWEKKPQNKYTLCLLNCSMSNIVPFYLRLITFSFRFILKNGKVWRSYTRDNDSNKITNHKNSKV